MSVGIFQNGEYNKVAGNAKDSTAANTTYNNGTSGLQANNVQSAIDEVSAKIGQENISQVGNSVTGAINNLNSNLSIVSSDLDNVENICYNFKISSVGHDTTEYIIDHIEYNKTQNLLYVFFKNGQWLWITIAGKNF